MRKGLTAEAVIEALRKCDPGAYTTRTLQDWGDDEQDVDTFEFDGRVRVADLEAALQDDETVTISRKDFEMLVGFGITADWARRDPEAWERMWRLAGYDRDPAGA
jgi:hypothetical protein